MILFIISTLIVSPLDFGSILERIEIEIFIKYFFIIGPSLSLMIYTFVARRYDDPFEDEMTCSDYVTNDNYNIMISRIRSGGNKIVITSILLIIILLVNIGAAIIRCFVHKRNEDKTE